MDFRFELALPEDDEALRALMATSPVPGHLTITYGREPNYFWGCGTMGYFWQVPVARHIHDGAIAGMGCRSTRPLFLNGVATEVGYLSQLRVAERFRGRWLVPRAFRFLRELDQDLRVDGYITTIIEESAEARGLLVEHPRRHHPAFREVGQLCTAALILRQPMRLAPTAYHISRGSAETLDEIVGFLRQQGATKQFFPAYAREDFEGHPLTRGFRVEDFVVARFQGEVVGVVGLWDQSGYKQSVIQNYGGLLRWGRPLCNLGLRVLGAHPLPAPGGHIRHAYASFVCIAQNDPQIFDILLQHLYNLAVSRGYAYLMVGLMTNDPLLAVVRRFLHIPYYSRLYTVAWDEKRSFHEQLDQRIPYLEIAAL